MDLLQVSNFVWAMESEWDQTAAVSLPIMSRFLANGLIAVNIFSIIIFPFDHKWEFFIVRCRAFNIVLTCCCKVGIGSSPKVSKLGISRLFESDFRDLKASWNFCTEALYRNCVLSLSPVEANPYVENDTGFSASACGDVDWAQNCFVSSSLTVEVDDCASCSTMDSVFLLLHFRDFPIPKERSIRFLLLVRFSPRMSGTGTDVTMGTKIPLAR